MQVSVTIDADAREIGHPRAPKPISFITSDFSSTSISSDTSSPQSADFYRYIYKCTVLGASDFLADSCDPLSVLLKIPGQPI